MKADTYSPDPRFSRVDARLLGPIALLALEAVKPYVERFFADIPESKLLLERTDDLQHRILEADAAHEGIIVAKRNPAGSAPIGSPGT